MPRGRPRRNQNQDDDEMIQLDTNELHDLFRERVCCKFLIDRMWGLLNSKGEIIQCAVCMDNIHQCGYLLLVCGHDQVCASCYQYMKEPRRCPVCRD